MISLSFASSEGHSHLLISPLAFTSICLLTLLLYLITLRYRPGLRSLPGPLLASISPLPRIWTVARGHAFQSHIDYHRRYGPVVRIGPNHVSISDATVIPQIYSIGSASGAVFQKSGFYRPFHAKTPEGDVPTVFSVTDDAVHRGMKRPVASAYSMSTMKELEPLTDECIRIFEGKMLEREGQDVDLGAWLHWYSFDVITSITFSNRLDFMKREEDVEGIIEAIEGRQEYNSVVGQVPYLHRWLFGSRLGEKAANWVAWTAQMNKARAITMFAARQLQRYQEKDKEKIEYRDMLDRFKRTNADGMEVMDDKTLLSHAASNIFAGSDTTAISLRSMFYYFCKNPMCMRKLVDEIDGMDAKGELSEIVTFEESRRMPYLQACMREAMRLHPAVGLLLERVIPGGGAEVGGRRLPGGTVVGVNPWVVARDREVYGEDADEFRPERWLEADEARLKLMDRNDLGFGAGSRTCLGKNISLLEMSKLVPQVLRRFEVELTDPSKEWELHDYWFVRQTGLSCKLRRRKGLQ